MNTWNSIAWFPICVGVTAAGLVYSWFAWRRRGARRGTRAVAWSVLPLAAYLTGAILLIGRIGSAIVQFAGSFVFSPKTWAGVALFGLSVLLFLASGGMPKVRKDKKRARKAEAKQAAATAGGNAAVTAGGQRGAEVTMPAPKPAKVPRGKGADDDNGLDADVAEILRRRGIN
jgi:type II secretory pathway pseudopilin PulG